MAADFSPVQTSQGQRNICANAQTLAVGPTLLFPVSSFKSDKILSFEREGLSSMAQRNVMTMTVEEARAENIRMVAELNEESNQGSSNLPCKDSGVIGKIVFARDVAMMLQPASEAIKRPRNDEEGVELDDVIELDLEGGLVNGGMSFNVIEENSQSEENQSASVGQFPDPVKLPEDDSEDIIEGIKSPAAVLKTAQNPFIAALITVYRAVAYFFSFEWLSFSKKEDKGQEMKDMSHSNESVSSNEPNFQVNDFLDEFRSPPGTITRATQFFTNIFSPPLPLESGLSALILVDSPFDVPELPLSMDDDNEKVQPGRGNGLNSSMVIVESDHDCDTEVDSGYNSEAGFGEVLNDSDIGLLNDDDLLQADASEEEDLVDDFDEFNTAPQQDAKPGLLAKLTSIFADNSEDPSIEDLLKLEEKLFNNEASELLNE